MNYSFLWWVFQKKSFFFKICYLRLPSLYFDLYIRASKDKNQIECEICTFAYHLIGFRWWEIQIWGPSFNIFCQGSLDLLLDHQTLTLAKIRNVVIVYIYIQSNYRFLSWRFQKWGPFLHNSWFKAAYSLFFISWPPNCGL